MADDKAPYYYELLKPLLSVLRDKGISISPETHITVISVLKGFQNDISDLDDVLRHVLPVLAKNAAEHKLISEEFRKHVVRSDKADSWVTEHKKTPRPEAPAPKIPFYKNPVFYFVVFIVAIVTLNVVAYQLRQPHRHVVTDVIPAPVKADTAPVKSKDSSDIVHIANVPAAATNSSSNADATTMPGDANGASQSVKEQSAINVVIDVILHPLFLLLMACIPGYLYLRNVRLKKIRDRKLRLKQIIYSFRGTEGPVEVIFENKNKLIDDEIDLLILNRTYNSKIESEHMVLDIPGSINATIRSEGFLQMEWKNLQEEQELLIIIDKDNLSYSQLIAYLLTRFDKKDNIAQFYLSQEQEGFCVNDAYPHGIHLSSLHRLYAHRVLLVFSDGYSFFNKWQPTINKGLTSLLQRWQTNAIITPVPLPDWKDKEQALSELISLIPADLIGLQFLFSRMDKQQQIKLNRKRSALSSSGTDHYIFGSTNDLKRYLNDEFLFQWVCALAVFPRMDWNMTIAIGHALRQENFRNRKINYTVLLKLVRINWMSSNAIPMDVRLALLLELEPTSEKTARLAIIKLLDEAAMQTIPGTFAYEELQLQTMSNKFIMYSQDPQHYARYKKEFEDYKLLLDNRQVAYATLLQYLTKDEGKGKWSTLLNNKNLSPEAKDSLPFVETLITGPDKWLKKSQSIILCLVIFIGAYLILRNFVDRHILGMAFFLWSLLLIPILRDDGEKENVLF